MWEAIDCWGQFSRNSPFCLDLRLRLLSGVVRHNAGWMVLGKFVGALSDSTGAWGSKSSGHPLEVLEQRSDKFKSGFLDQGQRYHKFHLICPPLMFSVLKVLWWIPYFVCLAFPPPPQDFYRKTSSSAWVKLYALCSRAFIKNWERIGCPTHKTQWQASLGWFGLATFTLPQPCAKRRYKNEERIPGLSWVFGKEH